MSYRLTGTARDDLRTLYRDGVRNFGEVAAKRYIAGLRETFLRLSSFPALGPERLGYDRPFRTLPYGVHVILYRAEAGDDVLILRVRHGREDWWAAPDIDAPIGA